MLIPQKHKPGARVKYNSSFFLTTNTYPDFGNDRDCEDIRKRLDIFQTTSLKEKTDKSIPSKFLSLILLLSLGSKTFWLNVYTMLCDSPFILKTGCECIAWTFSTPLHTSWKPSHCFDNPVDEELRTGAVYNDFNSNSLQLTSKVCSEFRFSQPLRTPCMGDSTGRQRIRRMRRHLHQKGPQTGNWPRRMLDNFDDTRVGC